MANILSIEKTVLPSHARRGVHLSVLSRAIDGEYVVSGGYVRQHAAEANMSVDVDEVTYRYGGSEVTIPGTSTVTIDTADEVLPRIDALYITAAGALAIAKGTAEAATADSPGSTAIADWLTWKTPSPPDMSSTPGVILAEILVGAGKTQILDAYIRMLGQHGVAVTGEVGADGSDGLSVLVLSTAPTSSDGVNGQMCIDSVAHMLYGPKADGAWPTGTALVGAAGEDGVGTDGLSILALATSPTASDGVDGQLAVDYVLGVLWGPKADGAWPTEGVELKTTTGVLDNYCTAIGQDALAVNEGSSNTAIGYQALGLNTTGVYSTALGAGALAANTTATHNTAVGASALAANTTGVENTAVGAFALFSNTGGSNNVAIGKDALNQNTTGSYNIAIGYQAMRLNTSGLSNVAIGHEALELNTSGIYNTAVGYRALCQNTSGSYNVALGYQVLQKNTGGGYNVAIGHNSLSENTTGQNNVAIGYISMAANTVGYSNAAIGDGALTSNTTGYANTAIGYVALWANTTGVSNVALGRQALLANTTGSYNVAVGTNALLNKVTGDKNTAVGNNAGSTLTSGENVSCIGYHAQPSAATTTDEIVLGNSSIARLRCQVTTITALSDQRDKTAIEDLPLGLTFLQSLKPRKFQWHKRIRNEDGTLGKRGELGAVDMGFVAQELQAALAAHGADWTEMILSTRGGDALETTTGKLLPIVVKAIQELATENESLKTRIAALEKA